MTPDLSTPAAPDGGARSGAVLDGNAAAGDFAGILASDPTTVTVRCGSCGSTQAFGQLPAYLGGPGTVLRCRQCEAMVARVAKTPQGTWLDLSGSSSWLFLPTPDPA
jgi:phage FluMu protein Com